MAIVLNPYAARLYEPLSKLPEEDDALAKVVSAYAVPFEQAAWVRGLGTDLQPYRPAMSVDAAGWVLPWLAQLVGVQIPKGTSDADARAMILARTQQKRGLPQTIID